MRAWRAVVAGGIAAAGLTAVIPAAKAAPLLAVTTRVGPTTLAESLILDQSADGRWVLAGAVAGGTVQRIDRQNNNNPTAPLTLPDLNVGLTDDGDAVISLAVDSGGSVMVTRTNPASGADSFVIVGSLGAGDWSVQGNISISSDGRAMAFSALDATTGSQVVAVANTAAPASVTRVDLGLPPAAVRRSESPSISNDGRYVAFTSSSQPPGCTDGPGCGDLWLRDTVGTTTSLISVAAAGGSSTGVGSMPRLSGTGRFVAFVSDATDLAAGVVTRANRVYVRDLLAGQTVLVPGSPTVGAFGARAPSLSDDGRLVAFTGAGQADSGGTPVDAPEVFLADLADNSVVQVSRTVGGSLPTGQADTPFLRADGSELVFASDAPDIQANPPLVPWNLYARRIGGPESAGAGGAGARARFVPLAPFRVLDTRNGIGVVAGKPGPGATVTVQVAGVGTVPAGASAVALNVTATEATAGGFVTVYPGGSPRPLSSNLNLIRVGQTIPNMVVVTLPSQGTVSLYTNGGTHLLADVLGYFVNANNSTDGRYVALPPARILDTRNAIGAPLGKVAAAGTVNVAVAGQGGVPPLGASAVVLNVTATEAASGGYVTVYPQGSELPTASNLNLEHVGHTIPNLVMVPIGPDGSINLFTYGSTHLIADVEGYFTDATAPSSSSGLYVPISPVRMVDTRNPFARPATEGATTRMRVNLPPLPNNGVAAAMLNVTATQSAGPGFVTIFPAGGDLPNASNLNLEHAGQTIPNAVVATLGNGSFDAFTFTGTHLIVDAFGYFRA